MKAFPDSAAAWLTPRRIRTQAIVLAICLWGVCAVDFATPGLFDRAGNIKFQDFLPFYISASLISQGRSAQLFNHPIAFDEMRAIVYQSNEGQPIRVRVPFTYGPQVGLFFVPLAHLSFAAAARAWVAISTLFYFVCIYLTWRLCPRLRPHAGLVAILAIAFPPFFHFFVRGQIAVLLLACFTAALLAFHAKCDFLAGVALGVLVFKPQFLIAIPIVLLLSRLWRAFSGTIFSAIAQLLLTWLGFGTSVIRAYFTMLLNTPSQIDLIEPGLAHIQMHSLRSFWVLLIPWPHVALLLYVLTAIFTIVIAAVVWKSPAPLPLRFSALTLAAVLCNPHLFIYDLLVLAPALLLLADWILRGAANSAAHPDSSLFRLLLYLAFVLPLFGPLARWTHLQLSIPAFVALLWTLYRLAKSEIIAQTMSS
jgi:arabinofuranan 3-O-arabinosyltransferase